MVTAAATLTVRPSDDCPSGIATAVRMAPAKRVHHLHLMFHPERPWIGHSPACGAGMGNPNTRIVLTSDPVTCPHCLAGDVL